MGGVPGEGHAPAAPAGCDRLGGEVVVEGLRCVLEGPVDLRVEPGEVALEPFPIGDRPLGARGIGALGEHRADPALAGRVRPAHPADGVGHEHPLPQLACELRIRVEVARHAIAHRHDLPVTGRDPLPHRGAHAVAGHDEIRGEGGPVGELDQGAARGAPALQPDVADRDDAGAVAQVDGARQHGEEAELDLRSQDGEVAAAQGRGEGPDVDPAGLGAVGRPVAHALVDVAAGAELVDDPHPLGGDEAGAEEVDHVAAAAGARGGLEHGDVVVGSELVGEGEAGDAASDDGDVHALDATRARRSCPGGFPQALAPRGEREAWQRQTVLWP